MLHLCFKYKMQFFFHQLVIPNCRILLLFLLPIIFLPFLAIELVLLYFLL